MTRENLLSQKRFPVTVVKDVRALHKRCGRVLADLVKRNNKAGRDTSVILPIGPLEYKPFAAISKKETISLRRLSIFMMDEYVGDDGKAIPESHPLSFARFMRQSFLRHLEPRLEFSEDRLLMPRPENLLQISDAILGMGGVDLCFAGMGLTGHLAFNDPPEPEDLTGAISDPLQWLRQSRARLLAVSRESCAQMAMGGTHGNWDVLPRQACTLGMRELLASKHIHLTFMRDWHSGVLRRALFGPIAASCPGSLVQEHSSVEATLTEIAARPPLLNVAQDTGEQAET